MSCKNFFFTISMLMFLSLSQRAHANNNYFLQGDAFFHTIITEDVLRELDKDPEYAFRYRFTCPGAFCGDAGYKFISLKGQNQNLVRNIKRAYYLVRESEPLLLEVIGDSPNSVSIRSNKREVHYEEVNGLSLLFYNEKFDLNKYNIAIKYNESWVNDLLKFGHHRSRHLRLCEFVKSADAVVESWRNSTIVHPLSVHFPNVPIIKGKAIEAPLVPKGPLKAIILYNQNYKLYFEMKNGVEFVEVKNSKITSFSAEDGKWSGLIE